MTDDSWNFAVQKASRSEARRLLAQVEADERYGIDKVLEILRGFGVRSIAQISEDEMPRFIDVCRRTLQEGERGV